jgi:hypothetical protein
VVFVQTSLTLEPDIPRAHILVKAVEMQLLETRKENKYLLGK